MNNATNLNRQHESGGAKGTFEITVKFMQNSTWQGQVFWVEKNLKRDFRSVLELLKLMDEALMDGEEVAEPVVWEGRR